MTLPLILFIYNQSSFVALLANLLVVPLIPIAMVLSFIAGMSGMLLPQLAGWLAWPARWLLTYLLDMASLVSRIPRMRFGVTLSTATMVFLYAAILSLTVIWWHKSAKQGKITDVNDANVVV
jgi:hypothetical protein